MTRPHSQRVLAAALLALALLFALWFHDDRYRVAALLVFVLPPLIAGILVWRGSARVVFWTGLAGLLWFSHGVMVAWSRPGERGFAFCEIILAVIVVVAASWPGLRTRFGR